jgi:hypothetical protein
VLSEESRAPVASKIAAAKVELAGPVASLVSICDPIWDAPHLAAVEKHGCAFWFRTA